MLSVKECATVDGLLLGNTSGHVTDIDCAWWRVLELLQSCSAHPQLSRIATDDEACLRLLSALAEDPSGLAIAQFCGYVGSALAEHEPSSLASYLEASANADYVTTLCAKHINLPEIIRLVNACMGPELARSEAIKRFLDGLLGAILADAHAARSDPCLHFLCRLIADGIIRNFRNSRSSEAGIVKAINQRFEAQLQLDSHAVLAATPPDPGLLAAALELCVRKKAGAPLSGNLLLLTERLVVTSVFSRDQLSRADADCTDWVQCMDQVIRLLIGHCEGELVVGYRLDQRAFPQMPATLLLCAELASSSVKYDAARDARARTVAVPLHPHAHIMLACHAAELLALSARAGSRCWSIHEIRQCEAFSRSEWRDGIKKRRQQRTRSAHVERLIGLADDITPPKKAPTAPPPVTRPAPPAAPPAVHLPAVLTAVTPEAQPGATRPTAARPSPPSSANPPTMTQAQCEKEFPVPTKSPERPSSSQPTRAAKAEEAHVRRAQSAAAESQLKKAQESPSDTDRLERAIDAARAAGVAADTITSAEKALKAQRRQRAASQDQQGDGGGFLAKAGKTIAGWFGL